MNINEGQVSAVWATVSYKGPMAVWGAHANFLQAGGPACDQDYALFINRRGPPDVRHVVLILLLPNPY